MKKQSIWRKFWDWYLNDFSTSKQIGTMVVLGGTVLGPLVWYTSKHWPESGEIPTGQNWMIWAIVVGILAIFAIVLLIANADKLRRLKSIKNNEVN